jgi:hypothetical protein
MSKKIILDLCGGTGAWSKPYADNGYDVRVITLPEYDIRTYELPKEPIYGILAAPPCTMFSIVRTTAKRPRDFREGLEIVEACERIIRAVMLQRKLKFWAMENPRGYLQQFIGRPYFEFDPTEFGDRHNKRTQIWGYFKKPIKTQTYVKTISHAISNAAFEELPPDYIRDPNMRMDAIKRSITPAGFAKAFYEANK